MLMYLLNSRYRLTYKFSNKVKKGKDVNEKSPLINTMAQIDKDTMDYLMWNDQPGLSGNSPRGGAHSKVRFYENHN
jgi:hypothetical protein